MIKTFRGILADDGQQQIYLSGGDGSMGYKINKLQIIGGQPAGENQESIVKIYKTKQTAFTATVDFSQDALLAVAYLEAAADAKTESQSQIVIFEQEVVNQDIFISHVDSETGAEINYYLELEEVKMSDAEAANINFVAALVHT